MIFGKKLALIILAVSFPVFHSHAQETGGPKMLHELSLKELIEVKVITASKRPQKPSEAPATIYVVTQEDIEQYGYHDLKDVLQHLPGIEYAYPQSHAQGGQRGFPGNWSQTKILINGRQINKLWSGEAYISSQYTLNNIKQIEIVQGPASALYGADAFTGVINIITKNIENTEKGSDFSFSLGTSDRDLNQKELSFNTVAEEKNLGITLSGTVFNQAGPDYTDFIRSAEFAEANQQLRNQMLDSGNPYRDDDRAYNANADFIYSVNDNTNVRAGIYFIRDEDGGGIENAEISFTNFNYISEQVLTYVTFDKKLDSYPVKITIDAFREDEDDLIRFQNRVDEGDNPPYLAAFNVENNTMHTINVQFDIAPKSIPNYLIAGFGYQEINIGEPAFTGTSISDTTFGDPIVGKYLYPPEGSFSHLKPYLDQTKKYAYLQDQHSFLNDKFQITLGGRYDHHNIYGDIANFRSGLYYQAMKELAFKALYGEAFREPTMFELHDSPGLKPAEMETWELSCHFNPIKNIVGHIVYYQNRASMIIEEQAGTTGMRTNTGSKEVEGVESLIKWQYKKFRGNVWYNYERDPDDSDFLNVAKYKLGAGIIYNIKSNISVSFQGRYTDKIKTNAWDKDQNEIIITIPEYKSFDLTFLAKKISFSTFPDIDLSFSIYNLFDTKNLYPNVRGPNPNRYLAEGRSFFVGGGIHF